MSNWTVQKINDGDGFVYVACRYMGDDEEQDTREYNVLTPAILRSQLLNSGPVSWGVVDSDGMHCEFNHLQGECYKRAAVWAKECSDGDTFECELYAGRYESITGPVTGRVSDVFIPHANQERKA